MRRALSITLLSLFCLPLLSPLLALTNGSDPDSQLPACCRRSGAHHCAMSAAQQAALLNGQHVTTLRMKCPLFPHAVLSFGHHDLASHTAPALLTEPRTQPAPVPQIEAWARIAAAGARHKRGPPTLRLS